MSDSLTDSPPNATLPRHRDPILCNASAIPSDPGALVSGAFVVPFVVMLVVVGMPLLLLELGLGQRLRLGAAAAWPKVQGIQDKCFFFKKIQ